MAEFKCGIEIHQRLDAHKLFCNCESILEEQEVARIKRRLRAVAGELGEVDRAAQAEVEKEKEYTYIQYPRAACLVELDCEPPHELNRRALSIVLEICILLKCDIVDEVQIMRKTVVDGSNTSGFQRTAIVGMNGSMETSMGRVGIGGVCIEEESAGIAEAGVFQLDRLGIPLVEIATDTSIKSPEHAKEVAEKLGSMLRMTGKVQRGIGTIRQDVNISIPEGARVEIKGAQELVMIPIYIEEEIQRQKKLIEIKEEMRMRGITREMIGNAQIKVLNREKWNLKFTGSVLGVKLAEMKGLLGMELQKGRRLGTELADHAKAFGFRGIIHSDEDLGKYGIGEDVWRQLDCGAEDGFVLIVGDEIRGRKALQAIAKRCVNALEGVPEETRRANPEGTSGYLRPLSGKARLYPETDVPPIMIEKSMLEQVKGGIAGDIDEKKKELEELLGRELALKIIKSKKFHLFEKLRKEFKDAKFIATTFENVLVGVRRKGFDVEKIGEGEWEEFFKLFEQGKFARSAGEDLLVLFLESKKKEEKKGFAHLIEENNLERITGSALAKIIEEEKGNVGNIMRKYGKRVDGEEIKSKTLK